LEAFGVTMKRTFVFVIVVVACCVATTYVAYTRGYRNSSDQAQMLRYADTIISLDAVNDLRNGHVDEGTHKVEASLFSHAAMIYGAPRFQQRFAGLTNAAFSEQIRHYLVTSHTNRADWTPTMVRLDGYLRSWP
jgi:cbb3-type cytochrome oxidase subunit 3